MKNSCCLLIMLVSFELAQAQPQSTLSQFSTANTLKKYVSALAHDSMQGRETGTAGMFKAAAYIAQKMQEFGLNTVEGNSGFFQFFKTEQKTGINVVGAIDGDSLKNELVIICAHYDHLGLIPRRKRDTVNNGANDNASGTAAVLYLASKIKMMEPQRTILFVAFSGEELGLLGSKFFASSIDPSTIKAVINFEMLGIPQPKRAYLTGSQYGNMYNLLNRSLNEHDAQKYGKAYFRREPDDGRLLFERSDNYSFAIKGIPAHTIYVTDDRNKHYHRPTDESQTLNYTFMSEVVEASFIAITPILNGRANLQRISVN